MLGRLKNEENNLLHVFLLAQRTCNIIKTSYYYYYYFF